MRCNLRITGDNSGKNARFVLEVRCSIQLSYQGFEGCGNIFQTLETGKPFRRGLCQFLRRMD